MAVSKASGQGGSESTDWSDAIEGGESMAPALQSEPTAGSKHSPADQKDVVVDAHESDPGVTSYFGDAWDGFKQDLSHPLNAISSKVNGWASDLDDCANIEKQVGQLEVGGTGGPGLGVT